MVNTLALQLLLTSLGLLMIGCSGPPKVRTPFLTSVDLREMSDRMAESFAGDEVIGSRTPSSERWVISMDRVVNHTNQIIPENERWLYLARLRSRLAQSDIAQRRNLVWIIPPERWPIVQPELGDAPPELRLAPTHLLTATFDALTRTGPRGRSDAYFCSYQLVDLQSGRMVWEDAWEVKRAVSGLTFD